MSMVLLDHEKLARAMETSNLTQEELAERLGISDRHLRNLKERDTDVSTSVLYRMSQTFQMSMESLLTLGERDAKE